MNSQSFSSSDTSKKVLSHGLRYLVPVAAMVITMAWPTSAYAQAYGGGVYGGSIYNGGSTVSPSSTPTPTSTPTEQSTPTPVASVTPSTTATPTPESSTSSATVSPTPSAVPTGWVNTGIDEAHDHSPGAVQSISDLLGKIANGIPTPIVSLAHGLTHEVRVLSASIADHPAQTASLVAASASVAAPAAAPLAETLPYLQWRHILSVLGLFFRRKRQPWGVVYDAVTKEPLDPVIITLTDSKGKQMQTVSDIYGRYAFAVEPGTYHLKAEKSNYQFPSAMLAGHSADEVYDDLYFGKLMTINNAALLNTNIPMDPVGMDWNQTEKQRMGLMHNRAFWGIVSLICFYGGLAWSIIQFIQHQTVINSVILLMYAAILLSQLVFRRRAPAGIIRDANGRPLRGAVIRLHNLIVPQLGYPPVVTKQSGQYSFLVNKGSYQVTAEVKGLDSTYHQVASSSKLDIDQQTGLVKPNLTVGQK